MKNFSARFLRLVGAAAIAAATLPALAQNNATEYRFTFPDVVHHVVQVEATFHNVPQQPLTVQMSRSSPGRYAAFEYASNVFEEKFTDESGKPLTVTRPDHVRGPSADITAPFMSLTNCSATASMAPSWPSTQRTRT